jgi:hypothetical protein
MVLDPAASAARTSIRLVSDFDPGMLTTAFTGPVGVGAGQSSVVTALSLVGVELVEVGDPIAQLVRFAVAQRAIEAEEMINFISTDV